jgi:hypothetical protein
MFTYIIVIRSPRLPIAATAAIEISPATSAYSIAFAPFWHRRISVNIFMAHSLVNASDFLRGLRGHILLFAACRLLAERG